MVIDAVIPQIQLLQGRQCWVGSATQQPSCTPQSSEGSPPAVPEVEVGYRSQQSNAPKLQARVVVARDREVPQNGCQQL
jgi:hypothetical protein